LQLLNCHGQAQVAMIFLVIHIVDGEWRTPSSRGEPTWGFTNVKLRKVGAEGHAPDFQL
jgi:hypothetical protein